MHPESLKVFCDLVSLRSFSKAAEANSTSQPTVTRVIHDLEDRLGGQLIDRSKRPLQLTALGQAYYEGCKGLLDRYIELEASLRRGNGDLALTVRVAAIYSVGLWDMGQYTREFEVRYPHAKVHIDYLHPNQVYARVLNGTADLGLVSFPKGSKELTVLPWREEEMVVACAPGHALAGSRRVAPARLGSERFVAFDKGLAIRSKVDRFLRDHGVTVAVAAEFDNIETIKKGIEAGVGVGLLPEPMLRQEVQAGTLRAVRLDGCELIRPVGIIHRKQQPPGAAVRGFVDLLQGNGADPSANGKAHK
jgi:DNA-binding transcriptional LysR family regulator